MRDFSRRSSERELMETEVVTPEEFARCLGDLARVNRLTFTHRPTLRWLARAVGDAPDFSLLDVGFGEGDMLRAIAGWAQRHGKRAVLSGIDLDPSSAPAAQAKTPPELGIDYRAGDVFAWDADPRPDFIISSLVTHHMSDAQVVAFLRWMQATAGRGWFVNDLHRHRVAYYGFRLLAAVFRWHRFVGHDGAVSITRAFRADEWRRLLEEAGVSGRVTHWLPFRLCVESAP